MLSNKIVIVTGASSGIGKAIVEEALNNGCKVAACGRSLARLKSAFPNEISELLLVEADVSKEVECNNLVEKAIAKWGGVDILINNAGVSMRALFENVDLSVIRELMDINFWGAVYCTKAALPSIRVRKGVVAGISSIAGYRGLPARTGYSASKAALQGFLEALRTELLGTGATALWISPGFTSSNIRNTARSADGKAQAETPLNESKLMSAEACAKCIMSAIEKRRRATVLTGQGKLTVWLNKLLPGLADKLVYRHFLKEPNSPLQGYGPNL